MIGEYHKPQLGPKGVNRNSLSGLAIHTRIPRHSLQWKSRAIKMATIKISHHFPSFVSAESMAGKGFIDWVCLLSVSLCNWGTVPTTPLSAFAVIYMIVPVTKHGPTPIPTLPHVDRKHLQLTCTINTTGLTTSINFRNHMLTPRNTSAHQLGPWAEISQ